MPQMGVSVSEGTIVEWKKAVGETVAYEESLLEISTDKIDTDVPSPASGVVTEILVDVGTTVQVGEVLARISTGEGGGDGGARAATNGSPGGAAATDAGPEAAASGDEPTSDAAA